MAVALQNQDAIFAANRATGRIALLVDAVHGRTGRRHVREDGSLRIRFPNSPPGAGLEAILVNTAGGMTGGDEFNIEATVGKGASLTVATAAAEKIYRSLGDEAAVNVSLRLADGARLAWLPQETILFDRARYARRIDVDLAENASLLLAEAVVFGRSAMGEAVAQGSLTDRWRIRRGSALVFAESVRLSGAIGGKLSQAAITKSNLAVATVLISPVDADKIAAVRALANCAGEVGISAWNGIAVTRLCAQEGAALRHDLIAVLGALGTPLPRLWLN